MINRDELGILIVEPSDTYQRILTTLLRRLGFTSVSRTNNPLKAQVLLQHNKTINVILVELMLPSPEQGVDFVGKVREKFSADELPVLMMTNLSEKKYVERAIKAGINGYLIKPLDPDHLEAHLWRLFDLPLRGSQKMGEFLVKSQLITSEQRDLALKFQKEFNTHIAAVALQLGYASIGQLKDWVIWDDEQAFMDQAAELGLDPLQIEHLNHIMNSRNNRLGDILVQFNLVDKDDLEQALTRFRARG